MRTEDEEILQQWIPKGDIETRFFNYENMIAFAKHYKKLKEGQALPIDSVSKPYYKGKWYYFGKCKPYPVQVDGYPVRPYKEFDTEKECQDYIDSKGAKEHIEPPKSVIFKGW